MQAILIAHAAATLAMTGLVWFVQVVHYPLLSAVGPDFAAYAVRHSERTSIVVGPLMATEGVTAAWLVADEPGAVTIAGVVLLAAIWLVTGLVSVPCHRRLALGFDVAAHRRLTETNWARTAGWSARSGLALALLA